MATKTITKGKKPFKGRTYKEPDGEYISVTSVLHPEGLDYPPELLKQYASRGSIVHAMTEHYLRYYQWPKATDVAKPEDIINVTDGSLGLSIAQCKPREFFQEYGHMFEISHLEQKVKNTTYKYAGRLDIYGKYDGKVAVCDLKTSTDYSGQKLEDYWMQQAAYANCISPRPEVMVIIPLNPKSPNGYDAPIVNYDVDGYFQKFLIQLAYVRENYLI